MKTLAHLGSLSVLALSLVACGGREIYDFGEENGGLALDTGASTDGSVEDDDGITIRDDGSISPTDAPWWEDTWAVPPTDSGVVPSRDSGTPIVDSGIPTPRDSGVVIRDSYVGTDTATPPDSGATMAMTCAKIARATCTSAFETCCKSSGFAYDPLACDDVSRNWCDDAADGVTAGRSSYNPAWADACAAGWTTITTTCQPHIFDYVKNQTACSQLFNGFTPVGGACLRSSDCRAGLGEFTYCDESAKRCRTIAIVGSGQTCNYFGAAVRLCDRTLTCSPSTNRCVAATPIGGTCFGADDTSCGIGNTCKLGKCAIGAPPGATCARDLECASWECQLGTCTDIRQPVANRWLCQGF